jgi:hypothetical protein
VALTGRQLDELAGLIGSTYGVEELQVLLLTRLDLQLYDLVPRGLPDRETIHQFLVQLDRLGRVDDILRAVKETRQYRPDVQAFRLSDPGTEAALRAEVPPGTAIPSPEQFINALCQLTAGEFDSIVLILGIPKADVGGDDLRGRAVRVCERVARPGRNRERNLLRLKSEIERLYPDAFTSGSGK